MKKWQTPSLWVNVGLGVLALAGLVVGYRTVWAPAATQSATGTRYVAVSTGPVVATVSASGSVASASTANVDFVTAGTVTEILVKVGDAVTAGQVLAKVDPAAVQDQLDTARANLSSADEALSRARSGGDAATIASAKAQVTQAQSTVSAQERALAGTVLKAPMAGTVTAVNGSVGGSSNGQTQSTGQSTGQTDSSTSDTGFVQLADLGHMQVAGYFAEADATKVAANQSATVVWNALSGARATGTVASISPTASVQNNVNSYEVVVNLAELPTGVRIGQTTTITVTTGRKDSALRVPTAAVRTAGGRSVVTTESGGTVAVQVGLQGDTFVEITGGLTEGERVAVVTQSTNGTTTQNGPFGGGGPGGFGPGGGGANPGAGTQRRGAGG